MISAYHKLMNHFLEMDTFLRKTKVTIWKEKNF